MAKNEVTDEQVKSSREKVDKLRDELAAAKRKQAAGRTASENALRKEKLDRQAEVLQAELDEYKGQDKAPAKAATSPVTATQEGAN